MGGLLLFGFLTSLAFSSNSGAGNGAGGILGGFLGTLMAIKSIKEALIDLGWKKSDAEKKEEKEKQEKEAAEKAQDIRRKALVLAKREYDKTKGDISPEAKEIREDYKLFCRCAYDENGKERSPEEFAKAFDNLPDVTKDRLQKKFKKVGGDENTIKQFKDGVNEIPKDEALAGSEECAADTIAFIKEDKLEELEDKRTEELEAYEGNEEKIKEINKEYDKRRDDISKFYNNEIKEHKRNAEKARNGKVIQQEKESDEDTLAQKRQELDDVRNESPEDTIKRYEKFHFTGNDIRDGDITSGNLSSEKEENIKEQLAKEGLTIEGYRAYSLYKFASEKQKEALKQKLIDQAKKDNNNRKKDLEKEVKDLENKIANANGEKVSGKLEPGTPGAEPINEPDEVSLIDDDGDVTGEKIKKEKDGDTVKYVKYDKDGNKIEDVDKEAFDDARLAADAWGEAEDEDERTDNDDDIEDEEQDEEKRAKQDPHKVWKHRTYKRGNKTFKTKSYYNKKGNSISAKEFKIKVKNYKKTNKSKKQDNNSLNINDYLRKNLLFEHKESVSLINYLKNTMKK